MASFKTAVFYSSDIERDVYVMSNVGRTELKIRCPEHSLHRDFDYLLLHTSHVEMLRYRQKNPDHRLKAPVLCANVYKSKDQFSPPQKVGFACYSSRHEWELPNLLKEAGIEVYQKNVDSKLNFKHYPKKTSKLTLKTNLKTPNKPMEITLTSIKQPDKDNPQTFTAVVKVDGTPVFDIKKTAGDDFVDLQYGKHHNAPTLGPKAIAEVEGVGWEHIHGYVQHLFDAHLDQKALDKFTKEVEDLCKGNLLFRLSKHTKDHEYEISKMRDTPRHREYILDTYNKSGLGIEVVEFINDRFKKPAEAPKEGLFALPMAA